MSPYPYKIPIPECPSPEAAKTLDPSAVLEFFRIEALLRSESVMNRYGKPYEVNVDFDPDLGDDGDFLMDRFGVSMGWKAVRGEHHRLLEKQKHRAPYELGPGVADLLQYLCLESDPHHVSQYFKQACKGSRYIYLEIDPSYAPSAILRTLKPYLQKLHEKSRYIRTSLFLSEYYRLLP